MSGIPSDSRPDGFAGEPSGLALYAAVLDDADKRLTNLLSQSDRLELDCTTFHTDTLPGHTSLLRYNLLLINSNIDTNPPGYSLYELLARDGRKLPGRIFVFGDDGFLNGCAGDLMRLGAEAVLPLDSGGLEDFRRHLLAIFAAAGTWKPGSPLPKPSSCVAYEPDLSLSPNQEDLINRLFVGETEITVREVGKGAPGSRQLIVTTGRQRQYFVKLARWDSITAEYANYVDLIQGKHENYAGRAIEPPVIRGSEAALRFSFAAAQEPGKGRDHGTSPTLGEFLLRASLAEGEQLLHILKSRLESNLRVEPRPFAPLKFLRVLPALIVVDDACFIDGPASANALRFPAITQQAGAAELRDFLQQAEGAMTDDAGTRVRLEYLTVDEIEHLADHSGVRIRLTDAPPHSGGAVCYRIDAHFHNPALFSSLKLHKGRTLSLEGHLTGTLVSQLRSRRPEIQLDWERAALPEERLYDLLFGTRGAGTGAWRPSPLADLEGTTGGDFTHGDLNLDNILVEERPNEVPVPWVIDFETASADFYPAYDWAKLEVEMAMHLTGDARCTTDQLLFHERSLWCPRQFEGTAWVPARRPGQMPRTLLERSMSWENKVRQLAQSA